MSDVDILLLDMGYMPSAERERQASPHEFTSPNSTFEREVPVPSHVMFTSPKYERYKR